jgi:hypothetical protein
MVSGPFLDTKKAAELVLSQIRPWSKTAKVPGGADYQRVFNAVWPFLCIFPTCCPTLLDDKLIFLVGAAAENSSK